jgi:hypothetical protein
MTDLVWLCVLRIPSEKLRHLKFGVFQHNRPKAVLDVWRGMHWTIDRMGGLRTLAAKATKGSYAQIVNFAKSKANVSMATWSTQISQPDPAVFPL